MYSMHANSKTKRMHSVIIIYMYIAALLDSTLSSATLQSTTTRSYVYTNYTLQYKLDRHTHISIITINVHSV